MIAGRSPLILISCEYVEHGHLSIVCSAVTDNFTLIPSRNFRLVASLITGICHRYPTGVCIIASKGKGRSKSRSVTTAQGSIPDGP